MNQIRLATKHDLDAVFDVETQCFEPGICAEHKYVFQSQLDHCPDLFYVADGPDGVVGYVTAMRLVHSIEIAMPEGLTLGQQKFGDPKRFTCLFVTSFARLPKLRGPTGFDIAK